MNILIYEPNSTGHRMVFLDYILAQMTTSKYKRIVLMTSAAAARSEQGQLLTNKYQNFLEVLVVNCPESMGGGILKRIRFQFGNYFFRRNWLLSVDSRDWHLFVPFIDDYLLTPFAFFGEAPKGVSWSGLAIRPRYHMPLLKISVPSRRIDLLEKFLYGRVIKNKNLHRLFCIDPYFEKYHDTNKVKYVHDPSNMGDFLDGDRALAMDGARVKILIYGNIDNRKGLDVIESLIADDEIASKIELYIVGRQESQAVKLLKGSGFEKLRSCGSLVEVNKVVSFEEEAHYFQLTDIVWVFYPKSYCSSGALVRAGQAGKPVVGTREGLVGKYVEDLNMGISASESDTLSLAVDIKKLINDPARRELLGRNGFNYFSKSTAKIFGKLIVSELETVIRS